MGAIGSSKGDLERRGEGGENKKGGGKEKGGKKKGGRTWQQRRSKGSFDLECSVNFLISSSTQSKLLKCLCEVVPWNYFVVGGG